MPFALTIDQQIAIARDLIPNLEHLGGGICQAPCPGADCHTTRSGPRDWRLYLSETESPHEHCVHKSCDAARSALMSQLYRALHAADPRTRHREGSGSGTPAGKPRTPRYAAAPAERSPRAEPYDPDLADACAAMCPIEGPVDDAWLLAHSPIPIPTEPEAWPTLLLDTLFAPGEHILIYTKFASQGQLMHTVGQGTVRLEDAPPRPGTPAPRRPPSGFPRGAQSGVWYQTTPVTGEWAPNPNNPAQGGARLGRRHAACCTRWPYLLLESDDAPPATWLRILIQLEEPVCAIYTSGGKSYHALIRVDAPTKEAFDALRTVYIARLAAFGADPAAITAGRLSRLPGCLRWGSGERDTYRPYTDEHGNPAPRLQRLLYLAPHADRTPICKLAARTH